VNEGHPSAGIDNPRAIGLLLAAWLFFTVEIVAIKALAGAIPVVQILFLRFGTQALAMAAWAVHDRSVVATRRIGFHATRSLLSVVTMILQYAAFGVLPLALATTLSFTQSLFLVALAAVVFGERIGRARGFATAAGFAGVVVLCRPGMGEIDPMVFAMLAGAFAGGLLMMLTKLLARTESPAKIMFYVGVFNTLWVAGPAWFAWEAPDAAQIGWLAAICAAGPLSHALMIAALRIGDAVALAPVDYVRLVFATLAGFLVFGESPDLWTWLGAAVILASTFALAFAERKSSPP
jgi:drug/metabolite transporter (DMT)-like permease